MIKKFNNRRKRERVHVEGEIMITVVAVPEGHVFSGGPICCSSGDASTGGLSVRIPRDIPVHSELELRIALKEVDRTFKLTGEVKWSKEDRRLGKYAVGVALAEEEDNGDMIAWVDAICARRRFVDMY